MNTWLKMVGEAQGHGPRKPTALAPRWSVDHVSMAVPILAQHALGMNGLSFTSMAEASLMLHLSQPTLLITCRDLHCPWLP